MVIGSTPFLTITRDEYDSIKTARDGLLQIFYLEERFDLLIGNYLDLETGLLDSAAHWMIHGAFEYSWFQTQRNLIVRRIVNLLTACRLYLDQTSHQIPEIPGATAKDAEAFKAFCSKEYDLCLGYRVMDALRDFVQHRGYPFHAISFPSKRVRSSSGDEFMVTVTPYMEPQYFRADGKFKPKVLAEIEAAGSKIDIKPLIRDYVEALSRIHNNLRDLLKDRTTSWETTYRGAITRFRTAHPDEPHPGLAAVEHADDETLDHEVYLFDDPIDHRERLARGNGRVPKLSRFYVTGAVVQDV
jgi:hypothetical protein